jgi:hypothetical protein
MSLNLKFIPENYKKRRENRRQKLLIAIVMIFVVFDGYIAINLKTKLKMVNSLENEINTLESMAPVIPAESDKNSKENKISSFELYENLVSNFDENVKLRKINLTEAEVTLEATIEGRENYINLLKKIENGKQWTIDTITPPSFKDHSINLNLHMKKVENR